jgi:hypothetical protein
MPAAAPLPSARRAATLPNPRASEMAPYVGNALSPAEIAGILAHAGAGCPLGPCQGCRHHEVQTGSCTA